MSRMTAFEDFGGPFRSASYGAGVRLQACGGPVERVWLVESGRVVLSIASPEGAVHVCASRRGGAAIGLEGISGLSAHRDAVVVELAQLRSAPAAEVIEWIGEGAEKLLRLAAEEEARCVTESSLSVGDAVTRAARFLIARETDPLMAGWLDTRLWEVACLLHMRPETLSRALRELEARGLIRDGRNPMITDVSGIETLAAAH